MHDAPNLTHLWATLIVEELVRSGVTHFFLAPGSRSTPLTTAVARHPKAQRTMHFDERGTAFAALGYGRAAGRPAAWITTSGTAVANGMPAAVEAATDGVPMLLLTADRPPELRATGANQTIDQVKIFGDHVRWTFDLPVPTDRIEPSMVLTTVDQAVYRTMRGPTGPVHLNCMFRKPLEPAPTGIPDGYADALDTWADSNAPYTTYPVPVSSVSASTVDALAADMSDITKGIVVAGRLDTDAEARHVAALAEALGWPLVPDPTSYLRTGATGSSTRIGYFDQILASEAFRVRQTPEAVLHVGGRVVSKQLRLYVKQAQPRLNVVVRPDPSRLDPDHQRTHHIESDVGAFCTALRHRMEGQERPAATSWTKAWQAANDRAARVLDAFADEADAINEPLVARLVTEHRPEAHALVVASSMPIRDVDRYAHPQGHGGPVFANRGASGIDGTVATAAGVARGTGSPVTLIIGDLALLHDLNSLALLRDVPVVVVAVNNSGGGIFHFLPIAHYDDVFEPYFGTPHEQDFEHAAALFGLPYHQPGTAAHFAKTYRATCATGTSALIEVRTERYANHDLHRMLEARIAAAVAAG